MKTNLTAISTLMSMVALASCSVETIDGQVEASGDFERVVIRAHNFVWAETPSTKTNLTISDTDGAVFSWAAGDIVGIYPDVGTQVRFPIVEGLGEDTQIAKFTGGGWAVKGAHQYMAYYPFIPDMDLDKEAVPVDYTGQVQDGNASTSHLSPFDYMAAAASAPSDGEISFDFKHLGALLMLDLTVPKVGEYTSLTLTCHDEPFVTKGTVDITAVSPAIKPTDWSNEFVIHLNNVTTTQANENVVVYALIPPVDMSEQTITVNLRGDHADCETSFTRNQNKPFLAGRSYRPSMGAMVGGDVIKLESGHQFNEDIKTLVNGETFIYEKTDYKIKAISFEVGDDEVPTEYSRIDVSSPDSPSPIYAYWKPETSELVVRTPSNKVYADGDASGMFNKLDQLVDVDFTGFDLTFTSSVASFFNECRSLVNLDLSDWNTGGITDFRELFMECKKLKNLNIANFDLTSAVSLGMMFGGCRSLTALDLTHFNTPNLQDPGFMFYLCESLESISFGERFNTSNVSNFTGIFSGCKSLKRVDISMFDMSNANSYWRLFQDCNALEEITGDIPVNRGTTVGEMYMGCFALTTIDVSDWDLSETTSLSNTFSGCRSVETLDVSDWKVGNIDDFTNAFSDCTSLTDLDVSNWNTSSATSMYRMFANCPSLTTLNVSNFITNSVTTFGRMFEGCSGLLALDVSSFNTESVEERDFMGSGFGGMFSGCSSLITLDLSSFSTGSASSLGGMFSNCSSLISLDLSSLDTSHIIGMGGLFSGCSSLTTIVFGSFDTHYCEDFGEMFRDCASLTDLDLSFFNTSSAKSMPNMFYGCHALRTLNLSSFDTSHLDGAMEAFIRDCFHLEELRLGYSFQLIGPWYFACDMAKDVESCTIYASQDFKNSWFSSEGMWGQDDSKLIWLNCETGEPLE